jgi:DeoR/GlpR family transcriptional regulator of sugar metabolism
MRSTDRVSRLVETLMRDGRVDVGRAATEFGTAEMTIRRDLDALAELGLARRVRGGAVSLLMRGAELPFSMRELDAVDAKRAIAAAVAALIDDGEAVVLDSGTTVTEVARCLAGRRITAMPLSLHATLALADSPTVQLVMPGGQARPGELALIGPLALAGIAALRFDTAVLGCCGITADGQVTAHDLGDAEVKQAMMRAARRTILAVDSSKFSHCALAVVCAASDVDVVVTDTRAPAGRLVELEDSGVTVHRV